jgi:hypothetical protein
VPQYFIPVRSRQPEGNKLFYQPAVIGAGTVHFAHVKSGVNSIKEIFYLGEVTGGPVSIDWSTAAEIKVKLNDLAQSPAEPAEYGELPAIALKAESYQYWSRDFANWLHQTQKIELWRSPSLKEYSRFNESASDFRIRLQQKAREERDEAAQKLRQKYAPKFSSLQEQMRRAQAAVEREKDQARQQQMQTAMSFGATLLSGFLGKKMGGSGRARSTASGVSRSMKESRDIERAQNTVQAMQQRMRQLEADFKADTEALATRLDPMTEELESVFVRPAKTGITIQVLALGWLPLWQSPEGKLTPAWE